MFVVPFFFFSQIVRACGRGKEGKKKNKKKIKHLNLQVCTEQTAAVFQWVLHAVSSGTLSAGLSVFSSNTKFVKSILKIKINISFIYLFIYSYQ